MTGQRFQVEPIAYVVGGHVEPIDEYLAVRQRRMRCQRAAASRHTDEHRDQS
jgi:hypothetical protein